MASFGSSKVRFSMHMGLSVVGGSPRRMHFLHKYLEWTNGPPTSFYPHGSKESYVSGIEKQLKNDATSFLEGSDHFQSWPELKGENM